MKPDHLNAAFEFLGGALILLNVLRLHRDKMFRGVHWGPTGFFAAWGVWNLFYYPHLDQWWSFAGGCFIVTTNAIWLSQMIYYKDK